jgi:hypothetical protein
MEKVNCFFYQAIFLNLQYHPYFRSFRESLVTLHEKHEDALKSLLTLKFQVIKSQVLNLNEYILLFVF